MGTGLTWSNSGKARQNDEAVSVCMSVVFLCVYSLAWAKDNTLTDTLEFTGPHIYKWRILSVGPRLVLGEYWLRIDEPSSLCSMELLKKFGLTINRIGLHRTLPDPATGPYGGVASSPALDLVQRTHNGMVRCFMTPHKNCKKSEHIILFLVCKNCRLLVLLSSSMQQCICSLFPTGNSLIKLAI